MMKTGYVFLCLLLSCFISVNAQESRGAEDDSFVETLMELLSEDQLEDLDLSELMEYWNALRLRPLDLNRVSFDDLSRLGFLSPLLIGRILEHREQTGEYISVNELQVIGGLDVQTAQLLAEVLTVSPRGSLQTVTYQQFMKKGQHDLILRHSRLIQKQLGYTITDATRSRYLGSPDRLLLRYRYNYGTDVSILVNMEKDPGEQFFSGAQRYGFDHYSASVQLKNQRYFSNMIIGDYVLQFGQGLGIWSGYSGGKGAILHGIARQGAGIKPHSSVNEVDFFRGVAVTHDYGRYSITPFFSYRKRDGTVEEDETGHPVIASLGTSGLHRTPGETLGRRQVAQLTYGLNIERRERNWRIGGTIYRSALDARLVPADLLRNQFAFSGKSLVHTSMYYQFNYRNAYVFGESARSGEGGLALLNGMLMSLHPHLSLAVLHRYYERDHLAFFAQAFGEGSSTSNEQGFYTGLHYHPHRRISWIFYADHYSFPWLRYRVDAASHGIDFLTQFTYSWSRSQHLSFRFRYRDKQENLDRDAPETLVARTQRMQVRLNFDSRTGQRWRLRYRVEGTSYRKEQEALQTGWMVYQDLFYQPMGSAVSGNFRVAFFGTTGYDSRIYVFENDVLYASSFPVYHHKGMRTYLNLRWKLNRRIDLWMRYAMFRYAGNTPIGSGLDLIGQGRSRSEVKTQVRIRIL